MLKTAILFSAAAICTSAGAYAQGAGNNTDTTVKMQELAPAEVRTVRASANAPFAKTDLTGADIQKQNLGQDLPLLLQYTPSAVVNSDAGTGIGYTGIHIRGVDPSRINVTLNGIPVNDPEEQATFFVDIPDIASSTGSIQIQRGVGTSTNGAGAFGGTISISNLQQMDSAGAVLSSSTGSYNTYKNTLVAGTGLLKGGWQFDVRLSKISSDGYIQRATTDLKSLQVTVGWQASDKTAFHLLVMTGSEKTGQAWDGVPQDSLSTNRTYNDLGLKPDGTYYKNQTDNYFQNYYQLFGDHKFSNYFSGHIGVFLTRGKGYYEEYKQGESYSAYGLPNIITPTGDTTTSTDLIRQLYLDNYYYGGVFSLFYNRNNTHITLGGGITQFENQHYGTIIWAQNGGVPDNYEWYRHDAQKNDYNVYLKAEQNLTKNVILFADMQFRNVSYYIHGFQDDSALRPNVNYDFYNPKGGITWLIKDTYAQRQRLYASVAVANKEPNHDDFEVDPAHLPKPERLTDYELGYEVSGRKWSAGAGLYYMDYKDQLVLTGQINDVGAYTQTNVPQSYRAGIELQGAVHPAAWIKLGANFTYSQNKIKNFTEYIDNYDSTAQRVVNHGTTDIAFSPNTIAAATLSFMPFHMFHGEQFEITLLGKYVGREYLDNTGSSGREIKQYGYCNLLLRYTWPCRPFRDITATIALNNLTSYLYDNNGYTYTYISGGALTTQNSFFPQAPFNILGGLTIRW